MTVYWTSDALDHVTAIGEYLRLTSPSHSDTVVNRFFDRARQLEENPYLGPMYPRTKLTQIRHLLSSQAKVIQ